MAERKPTTTERVLVACVHAAAGGAFFFLINYFAVRQPLGVSALWAGGGAVAAALLSWSQTGRMR